MTYKDSDFDSKEIDLIDKINQASGEKLSELRVSYDKLIEYYQIRFQIDFKFRRSTTSYRDAKQYWDNKLFQFKNRSI